MAGDEDQQLPFLLDDWTEETDFWALVPPPPPPPSASCSSGAAPLFTLCELGGPLGAHLERASFPSLPVIAVCSSIVLVAVLVASFLLWRHKSKVQNLLPGKPEPGGPGHLGELGAANGVTYEDVLINHHPTRIPQATHHLPPAQTLMPLEILDVKLGDIGPSHIATIRPSPFYSHHLPVAKPFHHPVYEEVSQGPGNNGPCYESDLDVGGIEDDLPEEEEERSATSSVRGSTGGDLCRDPVSSDEGDGPFGPYQGKPQPLRGTYPYQERTVLSHPTGDSSKPRPFPGAAHWAVPNYPSQENIYSTIDEEDVPDYPVHPPLASLAMSSRRNSPKTTQGRGSSMTAAPPPNSQRGAEDNSSSYGDMLPAFSPAPYT